MERQTVRAVAISPLFLALAVMLFSSPARATFDLVRIVEICRGTAAHPNAQYIVIMPFANLQTAFAGAQVTVWDSTGVQQLNFATFSSNLTCGIGCSTNQRRILVATPSAISVYGIRPDQTSDLFGVLPDSGVVCFEKMVLSLVVPDCVSYGNYTGPTDEERGRPTQGVLYAESEIADRVYEQMLGETDLDTRERISQELGDFIYDQYYTIPVVNIKATVVANPDVVESYPFGGVTGVFSHLEYAEPAQ